MCLWCFSFSEKNFNTGLSRLGKISPCYFSSSRAEKIKFLSKSFKKEEIQQTENIHTWSFQQVFFGFSIFQGYPFHQPSTSNKVESWSSTYMYAVFLMLLLHIEWLTALCLMLSVPYGKEFYGCFSSLWYLFMRSCVNVGKFFVGLHSFVQCFNFFLKTTIFLWCLCK